MLATTETLATCAQCGGQVAHEVANCPHCGSALYARPQLQLRRPMGCLRDLMTVASPMIAVVMLSIALSMNNAGVFDRLQPLFVAVIAAVIFFEGVKEMLKRR